MRADVSVGKSPRQLLRTTQDSTTRLKNKIVGAVPYKDARMASTDSPLDPVAG